MLLGKFDLEGGCMMYKPSYTKHSFQPRIMWPKSHSMDEILAYS